MTSETTKVAINGPAVRQIRKLLGIGLRDLAEQCCISRPYLCLIETGSRPNVSPQVFDALCSALRVTDRRALMAAPGAVAVPTQPDATASQEGERPPQRVATG